MWRWSSQLAVRTRKRRCGGLRRVLTAHARRAGSGTADEFIEAEVPLLLRGPDAPLVYVATSDNVSGNFAAGAGAVRITSDQLLRYIRKTDEEVRRARARLLAGARCSLMRHARRTTLQAKEVLRRAQLRSGDTGGRRMIARLDAGTSSSLLALRNRLNEEAKRPRKPDA